MAQAYNVYLSSSDPSFLDFEKITDIQPLTSDIMPEDTPNLAKVPAIGGDTEAINSSIGIQFNADEFISVHISDRKHFSNAKAVLSYITSNVDSTVLRFTQDGRVFYQGSCVAGANLKKILESLVTKKSKALQSGEYFLLSNLVNAPDYIKSLINPNKLKLCNIQFEFATKNVVKRLTAPAPPKANRSNMEVKTAAPVNIKPPQSRPVIRTVVKLDTSKRAPTALQKQFNVKDAAPWYKLKV